MNNWRDLNNRIAAAVGQPVPFVNTAAQSAQQPEFSYYDELQAHQDTFGTLPPPPPPPEEVGPAGRTYSQITGTDYLSAAERAWYLERTPGADPAVVADAQAQAAAEVAPATDPMSAMEQVEVGAQEQFAPIVEELPPMPFVDTESALAPPMAEPAYVPSAEEQAQTDLEQLEVAGQAQFTEEPRFANVPEGMLGSAALLGPALGLPPPPTEVEIVADALKQMAEGEPNYEAYKNVYGERDFVGEATDLIGRVGVDEALRQVGVQIGQNNRVNAESLGLEFLATAGPFAALRGTGLAASLLGRGSGHSIGRFMATELGAEIGAGVAANAANDAGLGIPGQIAAGLLGGAAGSVATGVAGSVPNVARNIANPTPPAPRGEPLGSILSRANEKNVTANYLRTIAEQRGIDVSDIPTTGAKQKSALVARLTEVHEQQVAQTAQAKAIVDQAVAEGVITADDVESLRTSVKAALADPDNPDINEALDEAVEAITVRTIAAAEPELSAPPEPKLRRDLAGADPRYLNAKLQFESDLDKAAYIVGKSGARSKRDADYLKFLMDNTGLDEAGARRLGRDTARRIGGLPVDDQGVIFVPRADVAVPEPPVTAPPVVPVEPPPPGTPPPPGAPSTPRPPSGPPPPGGGTQGSLPMDIPSPARPWSSSVWDNIVGVLGLPQTLSASGDLSAIARQGQILGWRNPNEWLAATKASLAALAEGNSEAIMDSIKGNPLWDPQDVTKAMGAKNAGLQIWEFGPNAPSARSMVGDVSTGTERVPGFTGLNQSAVSRLAEKIPLIGMSERAYATFLNVQGMAVYEKYAKSLWKAGFRDEQTFKDLAKVINHARGYGDLTLEVLPGINAFFSGRYLTSRFNVLLDPLRRSGSLRKKAIIDPETGLKTGEYASSPRRIAAENLAAFVAANNSLLGLMAVTGAATGKWNVEFDPRESDGGKIRIGETRIDPWAGFGPIAKLISRSADDITRNSLGIDAVPPASRQRQWEDEILTFFRNKASPVSTMIIDMLAGETAIGGEPLLRGDTDEDKAKQAAAAFSPFLIQDVYEAFKNTEGSLLERVLTAAGVGAGSAIGLGSQTYLTVREQQDKRAKADFIIDPTTGKPRARLDGEKGPGPSYSQLLPSDQQKIREDLVSRGITQESTITKSGRAFKEEHIDEQQSATELAFLEGQIDSGKTLPDAWKEWNLQKFGASSQRAIDYSKTIEGFPETDFSKLIEEYFGIEATFPNTKQYDPGTTEELRQKFLEELKSRPAPEGSLHTPYEVVQDYLDLIAGKKSPLEQDYRAFIKDLGNSGYYDLDDKGREAFMLENPEYEAQQAYWKSGVIGADLPKLKSVEAAEIFDALNATYGSNHATGIENFKLPYDEANKDAWSVGGPLVNERYFSTKGNSKERDAALEDPWVNAWLHYLGYNVKLHTGGPGGASEAYRRLIQQYGDNGRPPEFVTNVKVVNTPLR